MSEGKEEGKEEGDKISLSKFTRSFSLCTFCMLHLKSKEEINE